MISCGDDTHRSITNICKCTCDGRIFVGDIRPSRVNLFTIHTPGSCYTSMTKQMLSRWYLYISIYQSITYRRQLDAWRVTNSTIGKPRVGQSVRLPPNSAAQQHTYNSHIHSAQNVRKSVKSEVFVERLRRLSTHCWRPDWLLPLLASQLPPDLLTYIYNSGGFLPTRALYIPHEGGGGRLQASSSCPR